MKSVLQMNVKCAIKKMIRGLAVFNFYFQVMFKEIVICKEKCVFGRSDRGNNSRRIKTTAGKGRKYIRSHFPGHGAQSN